MIRINTGKVKGNGVCNIQKNGVAVGEGGNHNDFKKKFWIFKFPPSFFLNFGFWISDWIAALLLPISIGFAAVMPSVLLPSVPLVINKAKHCAPSLTAAYQTNI
jgi:hypothetical protein